MALRHLKNAIRRRRPRRSARLYGAAVQAARNHKWYIEFEVPDTVDGRFDMLALHLFLLQNRLRDAPGGDAVMQEVLETFVADMDQNLRQLGIGDPSMGREIRAMVEAVHGRFAAYATGLADTTADGLSMALARNVYRDGNRDGPAQEALAAYVRGAAAHLAETPLADILAGRLCLPPDETGGSET